MTKNKRISFILMSLVCILLLLPVCQVHAANATGTVKNRILNVRAKASTSSSIVCKLSQGTKVTITGETTGDDGLKWYSVSVTYNGAAKSGYVRGDLVTVSGTVPGSSTTTTNTTTATTTNTLANWEYLSVNVSSARVRERATTSSGIVASLPKGTQVKQKTSEKGTDGMLWIKVSFTKDGVKDHGYIRADLLAVSGAPAGTNTTTTNTTSNTSSSSDKSAESAKDGSTLYVSATAVRVREHAGTSYNVIANLLQGDKVTQEKIRTGDDGKKWTKVSFKINGTKYRGYIRTDYLTTKGSGGVETDDEGNEYRYITTAVRVREHAGTSYDIIANLLEGDKVKFKKTAKGDDGKEWTKITFTINGTHYSGYVRSEYLSKNKP